ncbi:MAG: hypothetical protein AB7G37_15270 [Solirubrobacteraceae bacterium]
MQSTGRRGPELQRAIVAARRTLAVSGRHEAAVERTVRSLPTTLADVRGALAAVEGLGTDLDPLLRDLRPVVRSLPATLREVRAALPSLSGLLRDADVTAREGEPGLGEVVRAVGAARIAVPTLRSPITRLNPIVGAIDEHHDGIGLLGERFSGIFSTADANGPMLRGLGFFEDFDPANFGFGTDATPAERRRAADGAARATERLCRADNPLACLVRVLVPGLPTVKPLDDEGRPR